MPGNDGELLRWLRGMPDTTCVILRQQRQLCACDRDRPASGTPRADTRRRAVSVRDIRSQAILAFSQALRWYVARAT